MASIQFNSDNTVHSNEGQTLNKAISNEGAPAVPGAASRIRTNTSDRATWNSYGNGAAQSVARVTSVQLAAKTGLITVPGTNMETTEADIETLKATSPELFVEPAVKIAEAKAEEKSEADAEARRADINQFVDPAAEGVALHFASEVPADEKIAAMVAVYRDGTLSESQIQNLAQKMHLTPDEFVVSWNATANNLQHQVTAMANAHKVNLPEFSAWMRENRGNEAVKALTRHALDRDVEGAYAKHMADFVARGNRR